MNLLERLKPEILEAINLDAEKFPHYVEAIKKELKDNYSWLNISINTASNLLLYQGKNIDTSALSELFEKKEE